MKKSSLVVVSILLVLSLFAACSKDSAKEVKKDEPITLTIGMWSGSPDEKTLVDKQIKAFEEKNPNITVKAQVSVGDYNQELQANIAAGTEADIFYVDSADSLAYIEKNAIVPLDDYLDKNQVNDFNKNLLDAFSKDGKIYGLPKDYNPLVMFVNTDMMAKAGATVPKNWSELKETLATLKEAGKKGLLGKDFKYPMAMVNNGERVAPFVLQNGGNIYNINTNSFEFDSQAASEGYDFYYDLVKNKFAETPQALGEVWEGESFSKGKTAIIYTGGWNIPFMKTSAPSLKYTIEKLPQGKNEGTMVFTVCYAMGKSTKHPKESAELIQFLTGAEAQKMTIESGLGLPSLTSLETEFLQKFPERKALIDMVKVSTPFRFGVNGRKANDALTQVGEKIYLDKVEGSGNLKSLDILKEAKAQLK